MASPTWSQVIDNLFTSTWAYRKAEAVEQAFLKTPFIFWLREKGRIENIADTLGLRFPLTMVQMKPFVG